MTYSCHKHIMLVISLFYLQHKLETSEANRRNLLKRLEKEKDQVCLLTNKKQMPISKSFTNIVRGLTQQVRAE